LFWDAGADGSQVIFTDNASAGLTSDTMPGSGTNLYRFDVASEQLTDLTPQAGADVMEVAGISEDGSYVYFLARGALAPGATPQPCAGEGSEEGCNLYLSHGGTSRLVAAISGADIPEADSAPQVSPNGAFLAFVSRRSLTGYHNTFDNTFGSPPSAVNEIFLYSTASDQVACASCNPSAEAPAHGFGPSGGATMEPRSGGSPRYLSNSGRLFFDTAEALLPRDTNGQTDVYEYDSGRLNLISAGTSSSESLFVDASESGSDVFFLTRQKLVPQDTQEEARNIYDARVDGGLAVPNSPPSCSTADACRSAASQQPSIYGAPSSQTFVGAGNLAPSAKAMPKKRAMPRKSSHACKRIHNRHTRVVCAARQRKRKQHKRNTKSPQGGK
jgi:hypothetical protein